MNATRSSVCSEPSRLSLAARSGWYFWTASGSLRLLRRPLPQPHAPAHCPEVYKLSSAEPRPVPFLDGAQGWRWFLSCPHWLCCCCCVISALQTPTITMTRSWLTAASGVEIRGESLACFSLFFHLAFSRNMYEVLYKCTPGELLGFLLLFYLLQGDRKRRNEYSCKYVCVCTYVCIFIWLLQHICLKCMKIAISILIITLCGWLILM